MGSKTNYRCLHSGIKTRTSEASLNAARGRIVPAPDSSEVIWLEPCRNGWLYQFGIAARLGFCRRNVAEGLDHPAMAESVDPFHRVELGGFEQPPRPTAVNDPGLVKIVVHLGAGFVIGIVDAAIRRLDRGLGQAFGILNRSALTAVIAIMYQAAAMRRSLLMQSIFQRTEHKAGGDRLVHKPTIRRA